MHSFQELVISKLLHATKIFGLSMKHELREYFLSGVKGILLRNLFDRGILL